jgi:hypothetical protein
MSFWAMSKPAGYKKTRSKNSNGWKSTVKITQGAQGRMGWISHNDVIEHFDF